MLMHETQQRPYVLSDFPNCMLIYSPAHDSIGTIEMNNSGYDFLDED